MTTIRNTPTTTAHTHQLPYQTSLVVVVVVEVAEPGSDVPVCASASVVQNADNTGRTRLARTLCFISRNMRCLHGSRNDRPAVERLACEVRWTAVASDPREELATSMPSPKNNALRRRCHAHVRIVSRNGAGICNRGRPEWRLRQPQALPVFLVEPEQVGDIVLPRDADLARQLVVRVAHPEQVPAEQIDRSGQTGCVGVRALEQMSSDE